MKFPSEAWLVQEVPRTYRVALNCQSCVVLCICRLYPSWRRWVSVGTMGNITCKALFYIIFVSIAETGLTISIIFIYRISLRHIRRKRQKLLERPRMLSAIICIVLMTPYRLLFEARAYMFVRRIFWNIVWISDLILIISTDSCF